MISTYTLAEYTSEYTSEDTSVEVTYENSEGLIYKRMVNIPHNEDGSIDEEYFQQILVGQLRGLENKVKIGLVSFSDPTSEVVGIAST